jgi:integral membrane sensor domain MASE1
MWIVAVPAAVVERPGVFAALGRSSELTKGHRWQILGLLLVYLLIVFGFSLLLGFAVLIVSFIPLLPVLVSAVGNAVLAAFGAVVFTVLYSELRRIKDGVGVDVIAQVFD